MEKINKHNYEAYFLDYLEGNLSAEEKADLFAFLEENPALKKELDIELNDVTLNPSSLVFADKNNLKVEDESILSLNTAEVWMIESLEKNLNASKQKELEDFIEKHQLQKTFSTYQATVLKPDLSVVYSDKRKLKVATGIVIPFYARVAAAAAVGLLLIGVYLNRSEQESGMAVTGNQQQIFFASTLNTIPSNETENNNQNLADDNANGVISNQSSVQKNNQQNNAVLEILPNNFIVERPNNLPEQKDSIAIVDIAPDHDNIVEQKEEDKKDIVPDTEDNDVVLRPFNSGARPALVTEEPYKIVTDAASNFTNREVEFTREKNTATNEYVAYGFKIGSFEFERKKSE